MNTNTRKWMTITGCLVLCAALVVLIGSQFIKDEDYIDLVSVREPESQAEIIVKASESAVEQDAGTMAVKPPETPTEVSEADNGAVSVGTEQTIQADAEKPAEPEPEALTDPTQTPDGQKLAAPPKSEDHDSVAKPANPPAQPGQPKNGDTKDGMIYVEGFGWVEDHGGGGSGTIIDGDGDINKMVGKM